MPSEGRPHRRWARSIPWLRWVRTPSRVPRIPCLTLRDGNLSGVGHRGSVALVSRRRACRRSGPDLREMCVKFWTGPGRDPRAPTTRRWGRSVDRATLGALSLHFLGPERIFSFLASSALNPINLNR